MNKKISIDRDISEKCNVNLGCVFFEAKVEKENEKLWDYIENNLIPEMQEKYTIEDISKIEEIKYTRESYKLLGKEPRQDIEFQVKH